MNGLTAMLAQAGIHQPIMPCHLWIPFFKGMTLKGKSIHESPYWLLICVINFFFMMCSGGKQLFFQVVFLMCGFMLLEYPLKLAYIGMFGNTIGLVVSARWLGAYGICALIWLNK